MSQNSEQLLQQQVDGMMLRLAQLNAENVELREKLKENESSMREGWRYSNELEDERKAQAATIESLNLRVARLVDALKIVRKAEPYSGLIDPEVVNKALSTEGDSQWLREKQAEAVKKYQLNLVQQFQEHDSDEIFITTVIDEILK